MCNYQVQTTVYSIYYKLFIRFVLCGGYIVNSHDPFTHILHYYFTGIGTII